MFTVHRGSDPHEVERRLLRFEVADLGDDGNALRDRQHTSRRRAVVGAVERTGRVFRINTWFRFRSGFYGFRTEVAPIKKAVQGGLLGWPIKATVSATTGFDWKFFWNGLTSLPPEPVPPELDYDRLVAAERRLLGFDHAAAGAALAEAWNDLTYRTADPESL